MFSNCKFFISFEWSTFYRFWINSLTLINRTVYFPSRSSVSSAGEQKEEGSMPQYHVDKSFADRRYKVSSARTYFYLNEATCERNMEIFIKCLEAVSGMFLASCPWPIRFSRLLAPYVELSYGMQVP